MQFLVRLVLAEALVLLSALWIKFSFPKLHPGGSRLIASLPSIVLNTTVQRCFDIKTDEFTVYALHVILSLWLSNSKVLAYALGRGPLSQELSVSHFLLTYILPITPQLKGETQNGGGTRNVLDQSAGEPSALLKRGFAKAVVLAGLSYLLTSEGSNKFPPAFPIFVADIIVAFLLYLYVAMFMDLHAAILVWIADLPISPHFDQPYLSASVSEFWSKRWDLTVANTLRDLIYDPISEGRFVASREARRDSTLRNTLGVICTFLVSGIMHEWLISMLEPKGSDGRWLAFFAIQGPLVLAERLLKTALRNNGISFPRFVKIPLTLFVLAVPGHYFFTGPALEADCDVTYFSNFKALLAAVNVPALR